MREPTNMEKGKREKAKAKYHRENANTAPEFVICLFFLAFKTLTN